MGEVFRARDPRLMREVAVKVLPARLASDPERVKLFEAEGRAAAALDHPNIVAVHEVGTHHGRPYLVTELLEGASLREVLRGGAMPLRRAIDVAVQIARGLAAAHEKGIVHRDLKPGNVFVTRDGAVKILDFGIAKLIGRGEEAPSRDDDSSTETDKVPGTAGYMAPEQVRGLPASPRSDLFALGCVVYEMLAGRRAFEGHAPAERLAAILHDDPPALTSMNRAVPPAVARVVERCLEKRPEDRFSSAHDMAIALQAAAVSSEGLLRRGALRRPVWWAAGMAVVAAGAIALWSSGAAVELWQRLTGRAARPPITSLAVLPLENLSGDPGEDYIADGMTEELITRLGHVSGLRVIARNSVTRFKGSVKPLREIAATLGVDALVVGSVSASGDRVRVIVRLVRGIDEETLWSGRLETPMRDVIELQSALAVEILKHLRVTLSPRDRAEVSAGRPVVPGAYDAYLRGHVLCGGTTGDGLRLGIQELERAVALDPEFTEAQAALATCWCLLGYWAFEAPAEPFGRARSIAQGVLRRDPGNAEAAAALGWVSLVYDWDWEQARERLEQAVQADPNSEHANYFYAYYLVVLHDYERAIVHAKRAVELDPLSAYANAALGWFYVYAGRPGDAVPVLERLTGPEPMSPVAWSALAFCLARVDRAGDAVEAIRRTREMAPPGAHIVTDSWVVNALVALGRRAEGEEILEHWLEREKKGYVDPQYIAAMAATLGKTDRALDLLDRAYAVRSPTLVRISADTWSYRALEGEPRFQALFRRMQYPLLVPAPQPR
jgi:serine/threonine-protein kinase